MKCRRALVCSAWLVSRCVPSHFAFAFARFACAFFAAAAPLARAGVCTALRALEALCIRLTRFVLYCVLWRVLWCQVQVKFDDARALSGAAANGCFLLPFEARFPFASPPPPPPPLPLSRGLHRSSPRISCRVDWSSVLLCCGWSLVRALSAVRLFGASPAPALALCTALHCTRAPSNGCSVCAV